MGEGLSTALAHPSKAGATVVSVGPVVRVSLSACFLKFYQAFWWAVAVVI